jgi:hypothetical protein
LLLPHQFPSWLTTFAGAAVIGSGLGLGSERDKKRAPFSPAHELVLLSLRTLANLSVPSGRLILLVKVPPSHSDFYVLTFVS